MLYANVFALILVVLNQAPVQCIRADFAWEICTEGQLISTGTLYLLPNDVIRLSSTGTVQQEILIKDGSVIIYYPQEAKALRYTIGIVANYQYLLMFNSVNYKKYFIDLGLTVKSDKSKQEPGQLTWHVISSQQNSFKSQIMTLVEANRLVKITLQKDKKNKASLSFYDFFPLNDTLFIPTTIKCTSYIDDEAIVTEKLFLTNCSLIDYDATRINITIPPNTSITDLDKP